MMLRQTPRPRVLLCRTASALLVAAALLTGAISNAQTPLDKAERADAPEGAPNVLLIVSDDLQACLGSFGHPACETPHLDRLAAEGVRFERAYCQYPLCGPSRASFMSGLYPNRSKVLGNSSKIGSFRALNPDLADHPSLGGFLRRQGWYAARMSKIYHMGVPGGMENGEPGGDDPDSWDYAFNVYGVETLSPGVRTLLSPKTRHFGGAFLEVVVPDDLHETQADYLATTQAIAFLENRTKPVYPGATNVTKPMAEAPFFLAVGMVRPHVPLVAPERLFNRYDPVEMELPGVPEGDLDDVPKPARRNANEARYGMSPEQQRRCLAAYFASVTYMDEQVGRLLDALDRLELRENTIVVFFSDHGYNLGEHGCWQKTSLWEDSTRVPLIISAPGFGETAGQASEHVVELIDLYPTLADLCGLSEEAPDILQGRSLRPLLEAPAVESWPLDKAGAFTVTGSKGASLRTARWRYSRWGDAGEELYDLRSDPDEFTNLANDPTHAATLESFRVQLEERIEASLR